MSHEIPENHAFCFRCRSTFPRVWIEKGDAPKPKYGKSFCSFTCEALHAEVEAEEVRRIIAPMPYSAFNE